MYKIKLADERYTTFEQVSETEVEVYSVSFEDGDSFKSKNEAIKFASAINSGKDGDFKLYGNKKAVSIVEYESDILNEELL